MEVRAIKDIGIGEDLTPPLPPLAAVLHDAAVGTHCSACFAALPPQPFPPSALTFPQNPRHVPTDTLITPRYCSLACSAADSALHFSSFERRLVALFATSPPSFWVGSSELRLSLRLAHIFQNLPRERGLSRQISSLGGGNESLFRENEESGGCLERIAGLMTNREKLVSAEIKRALIARDNNIDAYDEGFEEVSRLREGARMMARARGKDVKSEGFAFEEIVLCLVMTNAVEVQERNGFCIGIAVYDAAFSWINHSCSPNSCYWFLMGPGDDEQPPLRVAPAAEGGRNGGGLVVGGGISDRNGYGPRVVVRSLEAVSKGEEVTVAYLDLLQPKEMRQASLWLKYRFRCSCKRCGAVPAGYVDHALEAHRTDPKNPEYLADEIEELMQNTAFDAAITGYLASGDSKSCCRILELLLCDGGLIDESVEPKEPKSPWRVKLHPFHHLSINAYISLTSAYKVRASDLSALSLEFEEHHKLEALNMHKTSSAYSLLVAGVVNHLYAFEPAIVATAANFWMDAGESLLNLARSFSWDDASQLDLSFLLTLECDGCRLVHSSQPNTVEPCQKMQLVNCIAKITSKVWSFLATESNFLKFIQNPVDLSWLGSPAALEVSDTDSNLQVEKCIDQVKMDLLLLSVHCLRYGALLSSICYGLPVETNYRRALDGNNENLI